MQRTQQEVNKATKRMVSLGEAGEGRRGQAG